MTFARWLLLVPMLAGVGLFSWWHANARADPIVRTANIGLHGWPKGARPVRLLLASDVHLGNLTMDVPRLRRIVGQIDTLRPDAIVLAGDFVAGPDKSVGRKAAADMAAPLAALRAPLGVFAVLGNHDHDTAPDAIAMALGRAGITVLENSAARAGPLAITGIGDVLSARPDKTQYHDEDRAIAAARRIGGVPVALTHAEDRHYIGDRIELMLDGHTHCGQIDLARFGIYNPYMLVQRGCGVVRDKDGVTVTTAGLGTSILPLRYNAPPDLWVLTLGPAAR